MAERDRFGVVDGGKPDVKPAPEPLPRFEDLPPDEQIEVDRRARGLLLRLRAKFGDDLDKIGRVLNGALRREQNGLPEAVAADLARMKKARPRRGGAGPLTTVGGRSARRREGKRS